MMSSSDTPRCCTICKMLYHWTVCICNMLQHLYYLHAGTDLLFDQHMTCIVLSIYISEWYGAVSYLYGAVLEFQNFWNWFSIFVSLDEFLCAYRRWSQIELYQLLLELSSCGSSEHVVDELSQNNGRTMQRSTNDEVRVQCYICVVSRCGHVCRTYIPTFTKSCEIFTAYFYVHEMNPCPVSGFLDLISYLLFFFQAARNIVQKMLQNGKIWKISYFPPELSSCGSSELVWYTWQKCIRVYIIIFLQVTSQEYHN